MTRPDPFLLFKADSLSLEAGSLFIRAVTAGEHGRYAEQRGLVAEAADRLAKALALINPANDGDDDTPPPAASAARPQPQQLEAA